MKIISINYRNVIFTGFALGLCLTTGSGLFAASGESKVQTDAFEKERESRAHALSILQKRFPTDKFPAKQKILTAVVNNLSNHRVEVLNKFASTEDEDYYNLFQALFIDPLHTADSIDEASQDINNAFAAHEDEIAKLLEKLKKMQSSSKRKVEIAQYQEEALSDVWQMGLGREVKKPEEKKAAVVSEDILLTFVDSIFAYIQNLDREEGARNSRLHKAMLARLATMLDSADQDAIERQYLVELFTLNTISPEKAYDTLARLVSTLGTLSTYIFTVPNLKTLHEKARQLQDRDTFFAQGSPGLRYQVETQQGLLAPSEQDRKIQLKVIELLESVFQEARKASNDTVKRKLIALSEALYDAMYYHQPEAKIIPIMSKVIGTCLIFGPAHVYENINEHAGWFESYVSISAREEESREREETRKKKKEKPTLLSYERDQPSSKVEEKLETQWTRAKKKLQRLNPIQYLTLNVFNLISIVVSNNEEVEQELKKIRNLRNIFDYAYRQHDLRAIATLISVINKIAQNTNEQKSIDLYNALVKTEESGKTGYNLILNARPRGSWSDWLSWARWKRSLAYLFWLKGSIFGQWHKAIESLVSAQYPKLGPDATRLAQLPWS